MIRARHTAAEGAAPRRGLGLSLPMVVLLAAIAAIRVPLHDLGIIQEGSAAAALLVFVPLAVWVGVALQRQVPSPLLTLTVVGLAYGVMLAIIHQLFWGAAFGGDLPSLGGNLEGVLAPGVEAAVFRVSAFFSSLLTGTMVGAVTGAVAWAIARARRT
jgi:hypothetical protein